VAGLKERILKAETKDDLRKLLDESFLRLLQETRRKWSREFQKKSTELK